MKRRSSRKIEGKPTIKVVGVGSAGRRAVDSMTKEKWKGVEFICIDADAYAVRRSAADVKLWLEYVENCAEDDSLRDMPPEEAMRMGDVVRSKGETIRVAEVLRGARMVFIVAGMGGNTGTFASPKVAQIARELGILTVAVVAKPMHSEGGRVALAARGLDELAKHVDSMIVVDNEALLHEDCDDGAPRPRSLGDVFEISDWVLRYELGSIIEMINSEGPYRVDFADVIAVLRDSGNSMIGISAPFGGVSNSKAARQERARYCADDAIYRAEGEGGKLTEAHGILVNVVGDTSLKRNQVDEVMKYVRARSAQDAKIVVGASYDDKMMKGFIKVTLIATGVSGVI